MKVSGSCLREIRLSACCSEARAADLCGVSLRTYRRWEQHGGPPNTLALLNTFLSGYLDDIAPQWRGWKVFKDSLIAPNGDVYTVGRIMATVFLQQQIRALKVELREALARIQSLEAERAAPTDAANDDCYFNVDNS